MMNFLQDIQFGFRSSSRAVALLRSAIGSGPRYRKCEHASSACQHVSSRIALSPA